MRQIVWSDDALDDLDDMTDFVSRENPRAADLVLDRIDQALGMLSEMPAGRVGRVEGTYEWLVRRTSYIIAYSLTETSLRIVRIIHAARDWPDDTWPTDS